VADAHAGPDDGRLVGVTRRIAARAGSLHEPDTGAAAGLPVGHERPANELHDS
jgi:hypothetical protein